MRCYSSATGDDTAKPRDRSEDGREDQTSAWPRLRGTMSVRTFTYRAVPNPARRAVSSSSPFLMFRRLSRMAGARWKRCVQAEDALGVALLSYALRGLPLPKPRARVGRTVTVAPRSPQSSPCSRPSLQPGFRRRNSRAALTSAKMKHGAFSIRCTRRNCRVLPEALAASGRRLIVGVEEAGS